MSGLYWRTVIHGIREGDYIWMNRDQVKANMATLKEALQELPDASDDPDDEAAAEDRLPGEEDPLPATLPEAGGGTED